MAKRRIIRRRPKSPVAAGGPAFGPAPMTRESFGLKPGEECEVLVVGGAQYCSFTLARLGRLGVVGQTGITNSESHAIWALQNLNPRIVICSIDYERRSGGIDLMRKFEAVNPNFSVILTSSAFDVSIDGRSLRDLGWSMQDSWSFVTRRKTDNGDPLGVAVVAARDGVGWVDYPVRKQLEQWRVNRSNVPTKAVKVAV